MPFADIVRDLTPFFVTRQVFTGAGKVGFEAQWDERGQPRFQLTQRADFFETEVGLETTLKRPIINTRDEPHADPEKYRRLHVIVGDANMCEVAHVPQGRHDGDRAQDDRGRLPARTSRSRTPWPRSTRSPATSTLRRRGRARRRPPARPRCSSSGSTSSSPRSTSTARTTRPRTGGRSIGGRQCSTGSRATRCRCAAQLDWVAKLRLLEGYRERDGLEWADPKLRAIDLQYHDVRRDKGLYHRLAATGKVERLVDRRRDRTGR